MKRGCMCTKVPFMCILLKKGDSRERERERERERDCLANLFRNFLKSRALTSERN